MDTQPDYNIIDRKKDLIERLERYAQFNRDAGDLLDQKLWRVFNSTGLIFAIYTGVLGFGADLISNPIIIVGLAFAVIVFLLLVRFVSIGVRADSWEFTPGVEEGNPFTYEWLMDKYVIRAEDDYYTEEEYLNQIIADYAGNYDVEQRDIDDTDINDESEAEVTENEPQIIPGVIEKDKRNIDTKVKMLNRSLLCQSAIVLSLLVTSIGAVIVEAT